MINTNEKVCWTGKRGEGENWDNLKPLEPTTGEWCILEGEKYMSCNNLKCTDIYEPPYPWWVSPPTPVIP